KMTRAGWYCSPQRCRANRSGVLETKLSNIVEPTIDVRTNWLARVSEAAHALAATHVQEQLGGDTSRSSLSIGATIPIDRVPLVSDRDRWLDPPPARSWQLRSKSTLAVVGALISWRSQWPMSLRLSNFPCSISGAS